MKQHGFIVAGALFLSVCGLYGAMEAGSQPRDWPANPKRHTISITRDASDELGRKMIEVAETARPESGQWWTVSDGQPVMKCGLKTPHAVTKGALEYYTSKIREFQKKTWRQYSEPSSSLVYKATAERKPEFALNGITFKDVFIVNMSLHVSVALVVDMGGTTFRKSRTVVIDRNGVPQAIAGDADETFPMWMM